MAGTIPPGNLGSDALSEVVTGHSLNSLNLVLGLLGLLQLGLLGLQALPGLLDKGTAVAA